MKTLGDWKRHSSLSKMWDESGSRHLNFAWPWFHAVICVNCYIYIYIIFILGFSHNLYSWTSLVTKKDYVELWLSTPHPREINSMSCMRRLNFISTPVYHPRMVLKTFRCLIIHALEARFEMFLHASTHIRKPLDVGI